MFSFYVDREDRDHNHQAGTRQVAGPRESEASESDLCSKVLVCVRVVVGICIRMYCGPQRLCCRQNIPTSTYVFQNPLCLPASFRCEGQAGEAGRCTGRRIFSCSQI